MTGPSPEQIAALLSKREAIINRLCAEKKQLELQLVKASTLILTISGYLRPLNELVVASEDDYCSDDTEKGEWREPDDEPVAAGQGHVSEITFGTVRGARHAIDMLFALTEDHQKV